MSSLVAELRQGNGGWSGEVRGLPGSLVRGENREDVLLRTMARGLRALAELVERQGDGWRTLAEQLFEVHDE